MDSSILKDLLFAVITAAVPVITAFVIRFLKSQFVKIDTEIENSAIRDTVNEAIELIYNVVNSTSQTYVDSLKESGEFSKEAQKKAFDTTKEKILSILTEESKTILRMLYEDIDEWLDVQIESAVRNSK